MRLALGATRAGLVRLVVGGVARLALLGVVLGVLGALALGRGMQAILFETSAADPFVLGGAAVLLGLIAIAAGYFPARRAAGVSPVVALRSDWPPGDTPSGHCSCQCANCARSRGCVATK